MADRDEYNPSRQQARNGSAPDSRDLRDSADRAPILVPDRENAKNAIHYFRYSLFE